MIIRGLDRVSLQTNKGEDHDRLVSAPQGVSDNSADPGSDVNPETVELWKQYGSYAVRTHTFQCGYWQLKTYSPCKPCD